MDYIRRLTFLQLLLSKQLGNYYIVFMNLNLKDDTEVSGGTGKRISLMKKIIQRDLNLTSWIRKIIHRVLLKFLGNNTKSN